MTEKYYRSLGNLGISKDSSGENKQINKFQQNESPSPTGFFFCQTKAVLRDVDKNKLSLTVEVEFSDFYGFLELANGFKEKLI